MAANAQVRSVRILKRLADQETEILVRLKDGGSSRFRVAAVGRPKAALLGGKDFFFGPPTLFVSRLEEGAIKEAVGGMASDIGGFWLRYYNTPRARRAGQAEKAARLTEVELTEREGRADSGSANVQVRLADGRRFSILAATAAWFEESFKSSGLRYYFGPAVLFLRRLEPGLARKAALDMARRGDQWFCRYDTPRTTLSRVLADFRAAHP